MSEKIAKDILELIGKTPMVRINKLAEPSSATVYAKLESFNPGGSVKDRICMSMISIAEEEGLITPKTTIIEPTSGNTGIGLAMVCAAKDYKLILVMPETMSIERRNILKMYGAEIILTPGSEGMTGAVAKAEALYREMPNSFVPQQFNNLGNPKIHRETTAIEILEDTDGKLDAFVSGIGTGGTVTGVGEVLKEKVPGIKIIGVEPSKSPILSGGKPGPHKIQGIGAGFIPQILNVAVIDEIDTVLDEDAFIMSKRLAREEGILCGISSGAAMVSALKIAQKLGEGKSVVVVLPDTGERYLSVPQYLED